MSELYIFCGHLGSGKTEVALNFACNLKSPVKLCDLDFVNPYYRSREKKDILKENGVELISSNKGVENADIPGLSSKVGTAIMGETNVVLDIGGDGKGARVLGTLKDRIEKSNYKMFLVVNPYRGETDSEEGVDKMAASIEEVSGLKFHSIFYNPNYSFSTTTDNLKNAVQDGLNRFDKEKESYMIGSFPVSYFCGMKELIDSNIEYFNTIKNKGVNILKINRFLKNPWEL
ncbi:hypothetical protein KAJ27_20970 [bacterium]|nr:hypothetical protein [bacterium]